VVITGDFQVKSLSIQPDVISPDDREGLEDLLLSAFNQAVGAVREALEKEMGGIAGNMGLPPGMM
jgi:hypothetical protein